MTNTGCSFYNRNINETLPGKVFANILSTSKKSLQGAIGEALFNAEILCKAEIFYDDYDIVAKKYPYEGGPYDYTLYVTDRHWTQPRKPLEYRIQVKSTYKVTNRRLVFNTNHNGGKRYTENEIDFFFFCYRNLHTKEVWYGLALPSECTTTTIFAYNKAPTGREKSIDDYDYDIRFDELIRNGYIKKISDNVVQDETEDDNSELYDEEFDYPEFKDLNDSETFQNLLSFCEYDLDRCRKIVKMNKKTFMEYYYNFVGKTSSNVA